MIRTLNFAFIAITGFVCLGLYRIAEEARVAAADLRDTRAAIVSEQDALAVLGAEWARVTQPARIQALSQRHLDLSDLPVTEFSSLTQLPEKLPPLAPETNFATVRRREAASVEALLDRLRGLDPSLLGTPLASWGSLHDGIREDGAVHYREHADELGGGGEAA